MTTNKETLTRQRMLATDLDGTFIGDGRAMSDLWRELERAGVLVVFSTGRHLPSIRQFYALSGTQRRADACICMVGTEIWHRQGLDYRGDDSWSRVIADGWDKASVEEILRTIPEARLQPAEWQSAFKTSYYLEENADVRIPEIRQRLQELSVRAKVVYSAGRFLDVLPARSGKGEAVKYLTATLGVPPEAVITAGDTGNDLDMMRPDLGFRSIAVGNASDELRTYEAPNVYHASSPHAAGIREGLVHYGWLVD